MAAHNVDLSERVIAAAIAVHSALGPGLFESIYERALRLELELTGVPVRAQVEVPVFYKGRALGTAMRLDLLVDERLIAEIKSVSHLDDLHRRQVITFLRLRRLNTGLLINFNVTRLVDGIKRVSL
jgi:GxxExxY protein